jgi:NADPH2:quinone reductase
MAQAIRFHATGGPEVLVLEEVAVPEPGAGEARVKHAAIGVNYIDTYHRGGLYPLPLPSGLGTEAAGTVTAVGPGVTDVKVGDRVAYCTPSVGAYSTVRNVPVDKLVKLPDGIDERTAASMMLKGLTVQYLFRQTYKLKAGEKILFHAAAGGVGLIACQWARALGVDMIGTVGSDEKAELARRNGCAHTVVYTRENFVDRVKALTDGKGVPVVYDSVGKDTFPASLDCLQPRGLFVTFGNSSGPIPPFSTGILAQKGSLYLTRPTLFSYAGNAQALRAMAQELFDLVLQGKVKPDVRQTFPLREAANAHRALESRKTTGSTILIP